MDVVVYTRPDCENSRRIKEILADRGVTFKEHVLVDGKLEAAELRTMDSIDPSQVPVTVIDGVPITGLQRAEIEQAIGWIGF
jgi:glutaredoxin